MDMDSRFLMYQLMASEFQDHIRFRQTGSTVTGVSWRNFRPTPIRLPPLPEQHLIVEEVEARLSIIPSVDTQLGSSLYRAGRLRQSILKRAFAGQLVPHDEPATNLLRTVDDRVIH